MTVVIAIISIIVVFLLIDFIRKQSSSSSTDPVRSLQIKEIKKNGVYIMQHKGRNNAGQSIEATVIFYFFNDQEVYMIEHRQIVELDMERLREVVATLKRSDFEDHDEYLGKITRGKGNLITLKFKSFEFEGAVSPKGMILDMYVGYVDYIKGNYVQEKAFSNASFKFIPATA
jgi:hypothetical protein